MSGGDLHDRFVKSLRTQHRSDSPACPTPRCGRDDQRRGHVSKVYPATSTPAKSDGVALRKEGFRTTTAAGNKADHVPAQPPCSENNSRTSMRNHVDPFSRSHTPKGSNPADVSALQRLSLEEKEDTALRPITMPGVLHVVPSSMTCKKRPASSDVQRSDCGDSSHRVSPVCRIADKHSKQPTSKAHISSTFATSQTKGARPYTSQKHLFDPDSPDARPLPSRYAQTHGIGRNASVENVEVHFSESTDEVVPQPKPNRERGVLVVPARARYSEMILQPDSVPISNDQLLAEINGIYAGLVVVEGKCKGIHKNQMTLQGKQMRITKEQWRALAALHRTLLYEHHDFLLATQHPNAAPEVRKLPLERQMPFRMWRYGIHNFLELLRQHISESVDFMEDFIYLAYQMVSLLYETAPAFENVWMECLGDLARYRMAIETADMSDRDVWAGVARYWYQKTSDKDVSVGRLYHHLGILARHTALQQLYFYCKSLTCFHHFGPAKESLKALFDLALIAEDPTTLRAHGNDLAFIQAHARGFYGQSWDLASSAAEKYCRQLQDHLSYSPSKWKEEGAFVAVANITAWFGYGSGDNHLRRLYDATNMKGSTTPGETNAYERSLQSAACFTFDVLHLNLDKLGDRNVLPHLHLVLVFLNSLCALENAQCFLDVIRERCPWITLAQYLNKLAKLEGLDERTQMAGLEGTFLRPERGDIRPLPEDHLLCGLVWCRDFFPNDWFNVEADEEARLIEMPSSTHDRAKRVLWLGICLSKQSQCIEYDRSHRQFSTPGNPNNECDSRVEDPLHFNQSTSGVGMTSEDGLIRQKGCALEPLMATLTKENAHPAMLTTGTAW